MTREWLAARPHYPFANHSAGRDLS